MIHYFSTLFKASEVEWQGIINCVQSKVTREQNVELIRPVQDEEVRRALFHMHPEKSPGRME